MLEINSREMEVLEGMLQREIDHAVRCETIANRTMAERQKAWDLERAHIIRKIINYYYKQIPKKEQVKPTNKGSNK